MCYGTWNLHMFSRMDISNNRANQRAMEFGDSYSSVVGVHGAFVQHSSRWALFAKAHTDSVLIKSYPLMAKEWDGIALPSGFPDGPLWYTTAVVPE